MNLFKKSNQNLYLSTLNKYNSTTSIFKKKIKNLKNKVLISNSTTTIPILKTNSSFSNKNLLNKKSIINIKNQENDIKTVKNLTLWDKENLNNSNENFNILYSKLNELYIKLNDKEKIKELEEIKIIFNSIKNINSIYLSNNFIYNNTFKYLYNLNKKKESSIILNSFKTNILYKKNNINNFKINIKNIYQHNQIEQNKLYRKVINEKNQQENIFREDLIKICFKIFERKNEKKNILQKLNEIYKEKQIEDKKLSKRKFSINEIMYNNKNNYYLNNLGKDEIFKFKVNNFKIIEEKNNTYNKDLIQINNNFIKNKTEYENKLEIISYELNILKFIYNKLILEIRNYYFKILKNGFDFRYEGLSWIVKHLLEINTNLEYFHFPKYLSHEHIDYLIENSQLNLNQNFLIIILKALKNKEKKERNIEKKLNYYNLENYYKKDNEKDDNILIDLKIDNYLKNYKQLCLKYRDFFNTKLINQLDEENFTQKIFQDIHNSIIKTGKYKRISKIEGLLKLFEKTNTRLGLILKIRKEINIIKEKIEENKKNMIFKFKEEQQNIKDNKNEMEYNLIFNALFGFNYSI